MGSPIFPATWQIPTDLKIYRGKLVFNRSDMTVRDAYGNSLYRVSARYFSRSSSSSSFFPSSRRVRTLSDSDGNPLLSAVHSNNGWQCFRGNSWEREDLVFTVKSLSDSQFGAELNVFLSGKELEDQIPNFRLKGSPFKRSCTIYSGDSIVAQTNPLYKLGKVIYSRHKFRLTVYPGVDHALVIAMLVTFFG